MMPVVPLRSQSRATERHYTAAEVAKLWGISEDCVRRMFRNEPGVLDITTQLGRSKQRYRVLRIPQSVLERVHKRREVA